LVGVAVKVTLVPEQIVVDDAFTETDGDTELTAMAITLLVAVGVVVQLALEVMITPTWSALTSELDVNVGELVPTLTPFICHW
jgi:hypothetical protein